MATPRGRCHGIHDEQQRRGARSGSPFSFLIHNFAVVLTPRELVYLRFENPQL